jgi:hypothetical protein
MQTKYEMKVKRNAVSVNHASSVFGFSPSLAD